MPQVSGITVEFSRARLLRSFSVTPVHHLLRLSPLHVLILIAAMASLPWVSLSGRLWPRAATLTRQKLLVSEQSGGILSSFVILG